MSRKSKFTQESELSAVRLPKVLREQAIQFCQKEDLNLSQLLRRALRKELSEPKTEQEVAA